VLAKLTAILSSKAALAALGIVLVGGAATATTVAATTGHLGPIQTPHLGGNDATHTSEGDDAQGVHAHTISIQGTLTSITACPSSITGLTLTDAKTGPEHTERDDDAAKATKTPGAEATENAAKTPGAEAAENAAKSDAGMTAASGPVSVAVTKDTRVTGAGANVLADLCNHLKQRVEAQTTKGANGSFTAWKVTLLGGGQDGNGGNGSGSAQETTVQGTIKAVDLAKSSFTVTTPTGDVTVTVSAKTEFDGAIHALAQAKAGAHVTVRGVKQANGSIAASKITLEASH
jgi:hypothetical protein